MSECQLTDCRTASIALLKTQSCAEVYPDGAPRPFNNRKTLAERRQAYRAPGRTADSESAVQVRFPIPRPPAPLPKREGGACVPAPGRKFPSPLRGGARGEVCPACPGACAPSACWRTRGRPCGAPTPIYTSRLLPLCFSNMPLLWSPWGAGHMINNVTLQNAAGGRTLRGAPLYGALEVNLTTC